MTDLRGQKMYRYRSWTREPFILLQEMTIIRQTEKGVWVDDFGKERFILLGSGKRYGYLDKEAARESFIIRQRWRLQHLKNAADIAANAQTAALAGEWPEDRPRHCVFNDFGGISFVLEDKYNGN